MCACGVLGFWELVGVLCGAGGASVFASAWVLLVDLRPFLFCLRWPYVVASFFARYFLDKLGS